jgi:hypothetical protein
MRSVRCPWSLWSHCTWCHLTGWSLIPPATSLASRRSRCLLNQISSTSAICPWSLCPTTAMARCLLMKKNTTRTHSLRTNSSVSVTSNCHVHQDKLEQQNVTFFFSDTLPLKTTNQPTDQPISITVQQQTHNLMHPNHSQINLAKQHQNV